MLGGAMGNFYDIALLPSEAPFMDTDAYVVVDVLRATTTIAVLFEGGLADLVVAESVELATEIARREGRLLFGEVGGVPPAGFDHGNSPMEAGELDVKGRGGVLYTTNGTRALCALAPIGVVVTGALANLDVVVEFLGGQERGVVVCAGEEGGRRFAQEDFAAAGVILQMTMKEAPGSDLGDAAGIAVSAPGMEDWLASGIQRTGRSGRLIGSAQHARDLFALGLGADVQFATQENTSGALPTVVEWGEGWARLMDVRAAGGGMA